MHRDEAAWRAAQALNEQCRCVSVDVSALRAEVQVRLREMGLPADLAATHPHLFSRTPVFLCGAHARRMQEVVRSVERAVALPAYRDAALAWAPGIAFREPGARGAFLGFDFHLSAAGPRLIEINTNAGGGLLAAMLGEAALACCGRIAQPSASTFEAKVIDMLVAEWRHAGRPGRPGAVAIVDDHPAGQFLYPEFLLAKSALRRAGIDAAIAAPQELEVRSGALHAAGLRVDMVYNRLTDFAFAAPAHAALREAYVDGLAVVTPNPRAHALYADKRLLSLLGDAAWLRDAGLAAHDAELLGDVVPRTRIVSASDAAQLWEGRRQLFFKPFGGYGSRGAYRGDKLTRRVFDEILRGGYVAQALVAPPERAATEGETPLKFDVRNYAYGGEVQLLAARMWRGQTTNFRSDGGGFAPLIVLP